MDANIPITNLHSHQGQRDTMKNLFNWKIKQEILRRIFQEGQPVDFVARDFGVSESIIRKWCNLPEILLDPTQNVNVQNVQMFPYDPRFDPRQTQYYNNYHQQHPMYPPQFSQPHFGYQQQQQQQQVHPETPPLTPPTINEPNNESIDLSLATKDTSNMNFKPTVNNFLPQQNNKSSEVTKKHLDELFFVKENVTANAKQKNIANRDSAIEAGEVFLAWMSTCPERSSNSNLEVLRETIKRLKNYVPREVKKKDGTLDLAKRRKK